MQIGEYIKRMLSFTWSQSPPTPSLSHTQRNKERTVQPTWALPPAAFQNSIDVLVDHGDLLSSGSENCAYPARWSFLVSLHKCLHLQRGNCFAPCSHPWQYLLSILFSCPHLRRLQQHTWFSTPCFILPTTLWGQLGWGRMVGPRSLSKRHGRMGI